jgi:hypothetical protein
MDDMDDRATSEIATVRSSGFAIRIAPGVMADEPEGETRPFTRHDHDELRGRVAMTGSRRRGALPIRH